MREAGISRGIWNGIKIRQGFPNNTEHIVQFFYLYCYLDINHIYHWKNKLKKKSIIQSILMIYFILLSQLISMCVNDTQYPIV